MTLISTARVRSRIKKRGDYKMKNSTIIQAISLGFDFDQFTDDTTIEEIMQSLVDFMSENSDKLPQQEDECEVTTNGRSQTVSYGNFTCSGEIVDFAINWHKDPSTKVYHSDFVQMDKDGNFYKMNLYYLVGQTEKNAPEGFYFHPTQKRHVAETEDNG
jgi:hypothetical protein